MPDSAAFADLAATLRASRSFAAKADIAGVAAGLGLSGASAVPAGDDCAAIADNDGFLLFAIEGFINEFVARDPWFAGWCSVMVNISDITSMGGWPLAVVDAIWADGAANAAPILAGMKAAAAAYGVPIVGGHSNLRTGQSQLATAILGRAKNLLTSFDAQPGDRLIAAIDLRGRYREPFSNWEAATDAPPARLRDDLKILPVIADSGLAKAAKDISQGGIIGTTAMLAECSGVEMIIDITAIPRPANIPLARWLTSFPSYGYLLAVPEKNVDAVLEKFTTRDIAAAEIGLVKPGSRVIITDRESSATIWDFAETPLIGCGAPEVWQHA
jgi:AIR synthase-related protein